MSLESIFKLSLVMNMIDNLTGPMSSAASSVGGSVSKMDKVTQTFGDMAKTGAVMQELGTQMVGAVLAPVEATFDTRRALGELTAMGVEDLATLENAAKDFSNTWAGTTKSDFLTAAIDIKGGIDSLTEEGIARYTELSGVTAKATGSSIGEMTSLFATGYGIYKDYYDDLSDIQFGEMFSAGLSQAILTFKASGSSMAQSITALGGSATTANVPLEEQLGVLGMLQATMSGSEAGTKYRAFLRTAAKASDELGLSFLDTNDQLRSMPEILGILKSKYGETLDAVEKQQIQKAFGSDEAVALIDLLYPKIGSLQDNILTLYDSMGQGAGVAEKMASAINETEPERYARLEQRIQNVKESIGTSLLPTVNELMGKGEQLLTKVATWIENNQELVRVIMLIVLAVGGFLAVAGTIITVVSGVGLVITKAMAGFKLLKAGFLLAKGALAPLIGSVWSFTAALLANPITWIVIGIIALIAGVVLLYNKCEWFRNAVAAIFAWFKAAGAAILGAARVVFEGIGNVIGNVMSAAKDTVNEKLSNIKNAYEQNGGGIKGIAAAAFEGVKGIYTAGYTFIDNLTGGKLTEIKNKFFDGVTAIRDGIGAKISEIGAKFSQGIENIKTNVTNAVSWFFTSGQRIVTTFADGIKGAFTKAVDAVKGGLQKIRNFLPFSDAKEGPLSTLTLSGQRTMTTYAHGLQLAQDAPAEAMQKGLVATKASLEREPVKKFKLGENSEGDKQQNDEGSSSSGEKSVIIQKLYIPVDLKKIKDLQLLLKLLKEVEDYTNANGGDISTDPQPEPA
ncbi:MAG TPA: phage tail tape measure protein [Pseudoflavonifractor sp.]|nr:phage tail tape measure protein [Pseudoflavonifractor sp.]